MPINFISHRRRIVSAQQKTDNRLFLAASVLTLVAVLTMVLTSAANWWFWSQWRQVTQQVGQVTAALEESVSVEGQYLLLTAKVQAINELVDERRIKQQALQFFSSYFQPPSQLTSMTYVGVGVPRISLTLQSPEIFSFEGLAAELNSEQLRGQYPEVVIGTVNRNELGVYQVSLDITILPES